MNVNIPNILTFSRIVAAPVVSVLMFMPPPLGNWVPFAVYAFACVTDFFDGYLARAWHQQSALGRFMDPIADKLLIAAVLLLGGGLLALQTAVVTTGLPFALVLLLLSFSLVRGMGQDNPRKGEAPSAKS